ncbi:hypothetical protein [Isoptericola sp. NPDC057559]|uniref:hypothetical protein n=1 Tax=Isoptericola sp. NPDC057559 TaxID=3346168 RepID=UPI0036D0B45E
MLAMPTGHVLIKASVSTLLLEQSETSSTCWPRDTRTRSPEPVWRWRRGVVLSHIGPDGLSVFTGGVDSFCTLHPNSGVLSNLLFVHGFDSAVTQGVPHGHV